MTFDIRWMPKRLAARCCALAGAGLAACGAHAAEIDIGNPDWALRWDNTVKLSTAIRVKKADPRLTDSFTDGGPGNGFNSQAINLNAGDQNFRKRGFVSERADLLSEFDAVYQGNLGLRVSAAAWYDAAYHRATDAPADPVNGQTPYNKFEAHTRKIAGQDVDLLDAFVFGHADLGSYGKVNGRLGQHSLLYGESLFFGDNGVAAAQGPVDVAKLLASPNAQFKEIAMPVPQVSGQWQIQPTVSIGGYLQFRWKESRVPPGGSYFSTANIPWGATGVEYVNVPSVAGPIAGNYILKPVADQRPPNLGQFGLQLKWRVAETDLGAYFARFYDTFGQLYGFANVTAPTTGSTWNYHFGKAIKVTGLSASRSVGDFNVSAEASVREDMPLNVNNAISFGPTGTPAATLPTGRTAHFNLSALSSFGPNFLAQESSFVGEFAWNRVLKKSDPDNVMDAGRTRNASILHVVYTPTYRQVGSGLDLSVPVGVGYSLSGRSSVTAWSAKGTGSANIGVEGNYLNTWQFGVNYTHYIGTASPFNDYALGQFGHGNPLADRDYVSLNVRRTF